MGFTTLLANLSGWVSTGSSSLHPQLVTLLEGLAEPYPFMSPEKRRPLATLGPPSLVPSGASGQGSRWSSLIQGSCLSLLKSSVEAGFG